MDALHLPYTISKEYLHIISAFDSLHCFNKNVGNGEGSTRLCNHTKTVVNINMETKSTTQKKTNSKQNRRRRLGKKTNKFMGTEQSKKLHLLL